MILTNRSLYVFAALLGFSVPAIMLGRAVTGVAMVMAVLLIFALPMRESVWVRFKLGLGSDTAKFVYVTALLWLVSLAASPHVVKSFQTELRLLVYIAGAMAIWSALTVHRETPGCCILDVYMKVLVVSCVVLGGIAVFGLHGPYKVIHLIRGYTGSGIPAYVLLKAAAAASTMLIPVLVWAGFRQRGIWAGLATIAIGMQLVLVFSTANRSAVAGFLAAIVAVGLMLIISRQNTRYRMIAVAVMLASLGLALGWVFYLQYRYATEVFGHLDWVAPVWMIDAARQEIWAFAWNASAEWRWFGVGINAIDKIPGAGDINAVSNITNVPLHAHNWVVEVIVETGIFGFSAMAATIIFCAFSHARRYLQKKEPAMLTLIAVWAGYWGSGLFNFSYWSSWWQASFLLTTAVCLAGQESKPVGDGMSNDRPIPA